MSARQHSSAASGSSLAAHVPGLDRESRQLPPLSISSNSVDRSPRITGSETVINQNGARAVLLPPDSDSESRQIFNRLFPPRHESVSSIGEHSPNGIELDHFRIEERIGMGGMGAVFRAVDTRLQRLVALKLLSPTQSYDEASVKRFQNEARAAARLDHENVARVHYIGEERGLHFIAFEFVTGSTIRELIRRQHRISVPDSINYALQIAAALKHTSAMGVVHRDIKPSNIIITPNGRAKLVDLGLARNDTTESQGDLTLPGTTLGTFDYISPEQAKDPRSVDIRSDIYSLGCTLYHMLTGQPPYPEGTVLQKLLDHQGKEAPDPAVINRRVPDFVSAIVRKMMNSDRNYRHQDADQLIRELTYAAGQLGLRGINPEGLVWVASRSAASGRLASNAGWIATVALLLSVVGVLHQFPNVVPWITGVSPEPRLLVGSVATTAQETSKGGIGQPSTSEFPAVGSSGTTTDVVGTSTADSGETGLPATINPSETVIAGTPEFPGPVRPVLIDPLIGSEIKLPGVGELIPPMESLVAGVDGGKGSTVATPPGETLVTTKPLTKPAVTPPVSLPLTVVAPNANELPVALFSGDASLDRYYKTLEAACAAAEDGSTIELQFSHKLVEKSFRVARKNLTIRAARGHSPIIEFVPSEIDSTDSTARMITIQSGPLRLVNVQLQMTIPERPAAERYALFSMSRPGLLTMDRVAITVVNPGRAPATIMNVAADFGRMPADMPTTPIVVQREELGLQATDCVFLGQSNFADLAWPGQCSFTIRNCVAGLDGDFLQIRPLLMPTSGKSNLQFSMEHVTARLAGSFLRFAGPVSIDTPSVECRVRNSVFSHPDKTSFVVSEIAIAADDARRMLAWRGERNFFDDLPVLWSLESSDVLISWEEWDELWQPDGNVGSKNLPIDWMVERPFDQMTETGHFSGESFRLAPSLTDPNPATQGSTDGSDAGANLSVLPLPSAMLTKPESRAAENSSPESANAVLPASD
ncbi:MAG: serine/threonine-protein kinase [Planctomycetota bacterium]|nr:serine/threonine-protein kinase [Planctomycetota bacterium]